jgi:NAD(P)-dependent dehydrogenase (short-subunit alcohol dehydrogenase family)
MARRPQKTVLITGTSSGIGRASALALAEAGYRVYAGVRRDSDAQSVASLHNAISSLMLDVTKPGDIAAARATIETGCGAAGLYALINNAGHNYTAPFECTDMAKARALMETNFFGLCALTQSVLPALRQGAIAHRRRAKIVNIGSIGSLIGVPWEPYYHASKFALIGISESLRHEVMKQRISVSVVCPGGIKTPFISKSGAESAAVADRLSPAHRHLYAKGLSRFERLVRAVDQNGSPPEAVAKAILGLLAASHPPFRKIVGTDAWTMASLRWLLPRPVFHTLIRSIFAP